MKEGGQDECSYRLVYGFGGWKFRELQSNDFYFLDQVKGKMKFHDEKAKKRVKSLRRIGRGRLN